MESEGSDLEELALDSDSKQASDSVAELRSQDHLGLKDETE